MAASRDSEDSNTETPSAHRVRVAAAKLRVTLDERLGRETPPDVVILSKENY